MQADFFTILFTGVVFGEGYMIALHWWILSVLLHSIEYMRFILTAHKKKATTHLSLVMQWAYSKWSKRLQMKITPALDVCLDAFCHTFCLLCLLKNDNKIDNRHNDNNNNNS
eukprot:Pgem_evm1s19126